MTIKVGTPFQKGRSGNPKGRPKRDIVLAEAAREHTEQALNVLISALKDPSKSIAIKAATEILDRGWGKAPQTIDLGNKDGEAFKTARDLEELESDGLGALVALAERVAAEERTGEEKLIGVHEADIQGP